MGRRGLPVFAKPGVPPLPTALPPSVLHLWTVQLATLTGAR